MNTEQSAVPPPGLLKRLSTPVFWLVALLVGVVCATFLFLAAGLTVLAISPTSDAIAYAALAGGLVGFIGPIIYLRAQRSGPKQPTVRNDPPTFAPDQGAAGPQSPGPHSANARKPYRRGFIDKLIDLNFKTTDGITLFFRFRSASRGVVVDDYQQTELRRSYRRFFYWVGAVLLLGNILVGPLLPLLFIPALFLGLFADTNDVLAPPPPPDRMTFAESFRRSASSLPAWTIWGPLIISVAFTAYGCWMFVHEALTARRMAMLGIDYDDSILEACGIVLLFSFGITMMSAMLSVRRRHAQAAVDGATR